MFYWVHLAWAGFKLAPNSQKLWHKQKSCTLFSLLLIKHFHPQYKVMCFFYIDLCSWSLIIDGPSLWLPYGSWIDNYLCNQCLSPLKVRGPEIILENSVFIFYSQCYFLK
jgi:hypothetical protein